MYLRLDLFFGQSQHSDIGVLDKTSHCILKVSHAIGMMIKFTITINKPITVWFYFKPFICNVGH